MLKKPKIFCWNLQKRFWIFSEIVWNTWASLNVFDGRGMGGTATARPGRGPARPAPPAARPAAPARPGARPRAAARLYARRHRLSERIPDQVSRAPVVANFVLFFTGAQAMQVLEISQIITRIICTIVSFEKLKKHSKEISSTSERNAANLARRMEHFVVSCDSI